MERWILQDLGLDDQNELSEYILAYSAFRIKNHRVLISIAVDGDTSVTIDGSVEEDNVQPHVGAVIVRKCLKLWPSLLEMALTKGVTPFCYPTDTDSAFGKRIQLFQMAGFVVRNDKMICGGS